MSRQWCTACDQGWVLPARVEATGTSIWFCQECEAVWFNGKEVDVHQGDDTLRAYLESLGLTYMGADLTLLEEANSAEDASD